MEIDSSEMLRINLISLYLNIVMVVSFVLCVFYYDFLKLGGKFKQKKYTLVGDFIKRDFLYFVLICWNYFEIMLVIKKIIVYKKVDLIYRVLEVNFVYIINQERILGVLGDG